jgi:hypothetical protein
MKRVEVAPSSHARSVIFFRESRGRARIVAPECMRDIVGAFQHEAEEHLPAGESLTRL